MDDPTVLEQGWESPWYVVKTDLFELRLLLGPDEPLAAIDNLDAVVVLPDGSRWSASVITVDEVHRLMTKRWPETGEHRGGLYWFGPDCLIVREPGLDCVLRAVAAVLHDGVIADVLQPIPTTD